MYGVPLPSSQIERLAALAEILGPGSISVMIDHRDQLNQLVRFKDLTGHRVGIFVKIDTGYGRAGISEDMVKWFPDIEAQILDGVCCFDGFYSHAGHSYSAKNNAEAISHLVHEIEELQRVGARAASLGLRATTDDGRFVLSVGATPSATSIQSLIGDQGIQNDGRRALRKLIQNVEKRFVLELHAGVYPILDMQQLATRASPSATQQKINAMRSSISHSDIALTILAEVSSVYPDRHPEEALVAAGTLALGREPCKSYDGWGIVSAMTSSDANIPTHVGGWKVARISQEHGILQPISKDEVYPVLKVGDRLRIWPNHACIAGAGFGFYLVVDSDLPGGSNEVVDVWVRCRGW